MNGEQFPLTRPDIERVPLIESELADRDGEEEKLRQRVDELQRRYDAALEREEQAEGGVRHS